ncbi:TVP38/TMEM64 family inner membrane protein YdjZ [Methyloligella halotolerans]|uniref:TVP38/TMEM64 family membrane protein n=1 Tax=Methyloligella halotolerans TaxID=1177755 RepID=A0A1E2S1A9_9HYPH|nr:VTT domain-containing protein [Methyloligella halotolerans]ODA68241.1 TVP38/TMEM64 family inner membrane protein YdjZ [Methyloligella halotolerans]
MSGAEGESQATPFSRYKLWIAAGVFLLLAAGAYLLRTEITLPTEDQIKALLDSIGIWGPIAIIGLRCLAAILAVVPSSVVVIAAGAAYGAVLGTVYVLIGAELGAAIGFLIGRALGRDFVEERGWIAALQGTKVGSWLLAPDASQNRLMLAVLYCRLLPGLNLDGVSYVAGVTPLKLWRFLAGSFGGLLPYTLLLAFFGDGLMEMDSSQIAIAIGALACVVALPFVWKAVAAYRRRKGDGAPAEPGA